jgi:prolyl-tRNA editing enzyme YbaK/EbsC (Cys-tRNA(Pro) deacylase)
MSEMQAIRELLRTSQLKRTAATDASFKGIDRAKVVVCIIDGAAVPAVLPTSLTVNTERLLSLAGARELRFAQDVEAEAFSAEVIYVDVRLVWEGEIVFATDTAEETVAIRWADFARSVRPIVGDFAEVPRDRVGAHRLSYRE